MPENVITVPKAVPVAVSRSSSLRQIVLFDFVEKGSLTDIEQFGGSGAISTGLFEGSLDHDDLNMTYCILDRQRVKMKGEAVL